MCVFEARRLRREEGLVSGSVGQPQINFMANSGGKIDLGHALRRPEQKPKGQSATVITPECSIIFIIGN